MVDRAIWSRPPFQLGPHKQSSTVILPCRASALLWIHISQRSYSSFLFASLVDDLGPSIALHLSCC